MESEGCLLGHGVADKDDVNEPGEKMYVLFHEEYDRA